MALENDWLDVRRRVATAEIGGPDHLHLVSCEKGAGVEDSFSTLLLRKVVRCFAGFEAVCDICRYQHVNSEAIKA